MERERLDSFLWHILAVSTSREIKSKVDSRSIKLILLNIGENLELREERRVQLLLPCASQLPFIRALTVGEGHWQVLLFVPFANGTIVKILLAENGRLLETRLLSTLQMIFLDLPVEEEGALRLLPAKTLSDRGSCYLQLCAYFPFSARLAFYYLCLGPAQPQTIKLAVNIVEFGRSGLISRLIGSNEENYRFLFVDHLLGDLFVTVNARYEVQLIDATERKIRFKESLLVNVDEEKAPLLDFELRKECGYTESFAFALHVFTPDREVDLLFVLSLDSPPMFDEDSSSISVSDRFLTKTLLFYFERLISFDFSANELLYAFSTPNGEHTMQKVGLPHLTSTDFIDVQLIDQEITRFRRDSHYLIANNICFVQPRLFCANVCAPNLFATGEIRSIFSSLEDDGNEDLAGLYARLRNEVDLRKSRSESMKMMYEVLKTLCSEKGEDGKIALLSAREGLPGTIIVRESGQVSLLVPVSGEIALLNHFNSCENVACSNEKDRTFSLINTVVSGSPLLEIFSSLTKNLRTNYHENSFAYADVLVSMLLAGPTEDNLSYVESVEQIIDFTVSTPHAKKFPETLALLLEHRITFRAFVEEFRGRLTNSASGRADDNIATILKSEKDLPATFNTIFATMLLKTYEAEIALIFLLLCLERLLTYSVESRPGARGADHRSLAALINKEFLVEALRRKVPVYQFLKVPFASSGTLRPFRAQRPVDEALKCCQFSGEGLRDPASVLCNRKEALDFIPLAQQFLEASCRARQELVPLVNLWRLLYAARDFEQIAVLTVCDVEQNLYMKLMRLYAHLQLNQPTEFRTAFLEIAALLAPGSSVPSLSLDRVFIDELARRDPTPLTVAHLTEEVLGVIKRNKSAECLYELVRALPLVAGLEAETLSAVYAFATNFFCEREHLEVMLETVDGLPLRQRLAVADALIAKALAEGLGVATQRNVFAQFPERAYRAFEKAFRAQAQTLTVAVLSSAALDTARLKELRGLSEFFFDLVPDLAVLRLVKGMGEVLSAVFSFVEKAKVSERHELVAEAIDLALLLLAGVLESKLCLISDPKCSQLLRLLLCELGISCEGKLLTTEELDRVFFFLSLVKEKLEIRKSALVFNAEQLITHFVSLREFELCRTLCLQLPRLTPKFCFLLTQLAFEKYIFITKQSRKFDVFSAHIEYRAIIEFIDNLMKDPAPQSYQRELCKAMLFLEKKNQLRLEEPIVTQIINRVSREDPLFVICMLVKTEMTENISEFFKDCLARMATEPDVTGSEGRIPVDFKELSQIFHILNESSNEKLRAEVLSQLKKIEST